MSEFIRRHRGKIIAATVIAGGTYLAQKYIRHYYEEKERLAAERNLAAAATTAFGVSPERMILQNRRLYIFDSNHRTCDNSVLQIIPSIKTKLQNRFDVESLADALKRQTASENNGTSGSVNKLESWDQMKIDAVARLLSAAISYTILVISLKAQISILATQIYENSIQSVPHRLESWYSRMWYALGGRIEAVKPRTGAAKRKLDVEALKNTSNIQQLFLQALQFFVNKGVDSLNDFIRPMVADHLRGYALKDPLTYGQLEKLLKDILTELINSDANGRHFSFYVVPTWQSGSFLDEPQLEELLIILKTVLESPDAQELFEFGAYRFINGALEFVCAEFPGFNEEGQKIAASASSSGSNSSVPFARLIPTLTDAFHEISRVNFDSVLNNFIISQELHEFCMKVFDREQNIWHCLMIGGGMLIVLDIGLFIGGVAIIASGIDMDIYGFAAMITFSVLTMVAACLAFICGYRSRPPAHSYTMPARHPSSPSQPPMKPAYSQAQVIRSAEAGDSHRRMRPAAPVAQLRDLPPSKLVVVRRDISLSECSHNATWGGSATSSQLQPAKQSAPKNQKVESPV